MSRFEYKVVPAPVQGRKGKGVKGVSGRFALALESLMNELGAEGWDYVRADTLPCEERTGLTGKTTTYQNMLVFRRAIAEDPAREPVPEREEVAAPRVEPPLAPVPSPMAETAAAALPLQRRHTPALQVPPAILSPRVPGAGSVGPALHATIPATPPAALRHAPEPGGTFVPPFGSISAPSSVTSVEAAGRAREAAARTRTAEAAAAAAAALSAYRHGLNRRDLAAE